MKQENETFFEQWERDSFVNMYRARINDALSELRKIYDSDGEGLIDAPCDNEDADDWQDELMRAERDRACEMAVSDFAQEFCAKFEFGDIWFAAMEYLAHEFAREHLKNAS